MSPTRIDAEGKARTDDPPCSTCGWHCRKVWEYSNNKCDPKAGRHADRLVELCSKLPGVTASKGGAGYGTIHVTIEDEGGESIAIFFNVNAKGIVDARRVFWRAGDNVDETVELVGALATATINIFRKRP